MQIPSFDPYPILRTLVAHEVEFVLVGGVCGAIHGAPIDTFDLDIVHSRDPRNLDKLLAALEELGAYYREQPQRRIRPQLTHHQLLVTTSGPLDVLETLGEGQGYESLLPFTVEALIKLGVSVRMLDLPTLIRIKEEAGRDKDKLAVMILRRTLEEKQRMQSDEGLAP